MVRPASDPVQHGRGRAARVRRAIVFHSLKSILQNMNRRPWPPLLPILRSQQQGEILALLLGDPEQELSLTGISQVTGAPHASVYREVHRAEHSGLVTTRKVGNTRPVPADTGSPYYAPWTPRDTRL